MQLGVGRSQQHSLVRDIVDNFQLTTTVAESWTGHPKVWCVSSSCEFHIYLFLWLLTITENTKPKKI